MKTLRCRLTRDGTESPGGRTPRYRRQASMAGVLSRRCLLVSRRRAVGGGSNIPIGVVEIIYLAILYHHYYYYAYHAYYAHIIIAW